MAIYHCSIQMIGRSDGRSAVASAAYRAAEKLEDKETGLLHDYTKKHGVVYKEIMLPEYAPEKYKDRETLWNEVQKVEKRSNAQLAREIEVALPKELSFGDQITIVQFYVRMNFVEKGMCADWVLHDKGDGNPHAHILLTTRPIGKDGQWKAKEKKGYALDEKGQRIPIIDEKTGEQKVDSRNRKQWKRETIQANDWNSPKKAEEWRAAWADCINILLPPEKQVDHRSYARQGVDQAPTLHEGYAARKMERQGKISERCQENREIRQRNQLLQHIREQLRIIKEKLQEKGEELYERVRILLDHRVGRTIGVYGNTGIRQRNAQGREREIKYGKREAERREWAFADRSPEMERTLGTPEGISVLASESAKKGSTIDFMPESIKNYADDIKSKIEALQSVGEQMEKQIDQMKKLIEEKNSTNLAFQEKQPDQKPKKKKPKLKL